VQLICYWKCTKKPSTKWGAILWTRKRCLQNQTLNFIDNYLLSYVLIYFCCCWKQLKDKHAAYLKVSRLEKFFHELSLYEEKNFLKRYELREVRYKNPSILVSKCTLVPTGTCWLHAEATAQYTASSCREGMEWKKLWQYGEGWIELNFFALINDYIYALFFNIKLSSTQEQNPDGPGLTVDSLSAQCSISTCSSDKSDVGKTCLFSLLF